MSHFHSKKNDQFTKTGSGHTQRNAEKRVAFSTGKELAISVDDSKGVPINDPTLGNWSYETDWGTFLPYTDVLINMGTYPGKKTHLFFGEFFPIFAPSSLFW
jgi:hypothetical protein